MISKGAFVWVFKAGSSYSGGDPCIHGENLCPVLVDMEGSVLQSEVGMGVQGPISTMS